MEKHQQDVATLGSRLREAEDLNEVLKETNQRLERNNKKERARNLKLVKKV